jgi:adenylate cyclase
MTTIIQQYRGRVVDSPGDNFLAEFASVVDATECAVRIQEKLKDKNAELPENRRMQFRIGINLGDVIEDGERIYGDGVNITARLEGLAEPGGICISGTAYDQVKNKISIGYVFLGKNAVKNIKEPVRVYRLLMESEPEAEIVTEEKMAFPLPEKPSIAVLAFDNLSGDPTQEYFSDGLTEEIITALSKIPKLFVIARNSTFTYKGKAVKVQQVSEELGVQYVVEGSVRRAEDRVRITAQLIDALTGHHLWAEKYDRDIKDIFAVQDEVTMKIITALQVKLTEGEQARLYARGTNNLEAYLKAMEANLLSYQSTKDGVLKARQLAKEAIALDPNYAFAYKILGTTHGLALVLQMSKNPRESLKRAIGLFRKAIELDDSFAMAHISLGYYSMFRRQYDTALAEGKQAFELEPNSADVINLYAAILTFVGRLEEAIPLCKEALRLNPKPPTVYLCFFAIAIRDSGQYEEAIAQAKKVTEQEPNDLVANVVLTSSLSLAGRDEEARAAAKEILRINPEFSVARWEKNAPHKDRAVAKRFCDALRKAGLPD